MSEENSPAFPTQVQFGLTKREYFAAQAMSGIISSYESVSAQQVAREAVACADALIAELAKEKNNG